MIKQKKLFLRLLIILFPVLVTVSIASIPLNKVFGGYGEPGITPVCTALKPGTPKLIVIDSSQPNSIILYWTPADNATHYTIAYGLGSGSYIYGIPKVSSGGVGYFPRSLTINHLVNGVRYYFVIRAVNDCMPGDFSNELNVAVGKETTALGYPVRRTVAEAVVVSPIPRGRESRPSASPRPTFSPTARPQKEIRPTPLASPTLPRLPERELGTPSPAPAPRRGFFGAIIDFLGSLFRR